MSAERRGNARDSRAASEPKKRVSAARWAAFDVLRQIASTDAHSDDLLHGVALRGMSQADRNLATALVMGVLRWQIALDAELTKLLERPEQELPEELWIALRLGAFQLRHMDRIPAHAALSESVELVRASGHPKATGLVNAVLRRFSSSKPRVPIAEAVEAMAARLGHPEWIVRRWETAYGREAARAICEFDQQEPNAGEMFVPEAETVDARRIDDGSRLVAEIAAASCGPAARIWDACAAPGGKTSVLARRHPQAELLATDVSGRRLEAMRRQMDVELPGRTLRMLKADAARLPADEGWFDLILCDVPCSGTGTLARNPEIRLRLEPAELGRQARRQREILGAALQRLRSGGRLVYSTCSLEPEENDAVVSAVLADTSGVRTLPMAAMLEQVQASGVLREGLDLSGLIRGDALRTLPGANFRGDGFYAVVLERSA